jgi:hypothetical protein
MAARRIVVTVAADGTVAAETLGMTGPECLDYITLLEDLLAAQTVHSEYVTAPANISVRREQHEGL